MEIVKIHDAKTNLSKLIARVEAGEEIIIARDDKPVARLMGMDARAASHGFMDDPAPYQAEPAARGPRITMNPDICFGRPCIRGMRIRVSDVLDLLAAGARREQILSDYPYLESEDIDAALAYAASSANHRIIRAV